METTTSTRTAFRFGTTDTYLTPLGVGAMIMGTSTPEDEARRILDHFITEVTPRYTALDGTAARGMIDTADCYCWWNDRGSEGGHSEAALGRWLADTAARERVYLATKGTARVENASKAWDADGNQDWVYAQRHYLGSSRAVL